MGFNPANFGAHPTQMFPQGFVPPFPVLKSPTTPNVPISTPPTSYQPVKKAMEIEEEDDKVEEEGSKEDIKSEEEKEQKEEKEDDNTSSQEKDEKLSDNQESEKKKNPISKILD